MNTDRLKKFAPAARRSLLASVKSRAMIYGITNDRPEKDSLKKAEGDLVRINGILYPKTIESDWNNLVAMVEQHGFEVVCEQAAYTWFNRLMALRYLEVHGWLDHGFRVLSHPKGGLRPEVLEQAQTVDIPGLDRTLVLNFLADGKDEELYQYLLLQQCLGLHHALPLLFDHLEPAIRLLVPDNLLTPNSIIRAFVDEIPEEDWRTTEILGWLYQFYVLEEKQRVDAYVKKGQAVQVEDIPAKTQLFTPNWIVQFLTQNSLGRLWMDVYPESPLKEKMPYYTPPAEQEPEVAAKLKEITPASVDPKTLTAIDPAAGSGHILLELYSLFYEMYREQGFPPQQIPRLILENNLYGLELDRRAAQIAGFSLLMRARADDPLLLKSPPQVNVLALRHSRDLDLSQLLSQKQAEEVFPSDRLFEGAQPKLAASAKPLFSQPSALRLLKQLFDEADVVGSLIRVPEELAHQLDSMALEVTEVRKQATLLSSDQLDLLQELISQAKVLSKRYSTTTMNPPYMGGRSLNKDLKEFLNKNYKGSEKDVFAAFIARSLEWTEKGGYMGFMSPFTWMFISTFEGLRQLLITSTHLSSWVQLEYSGFEGATVPVCTFTLRNQKVRGEKGSYIRLSDFKGSENQAPRTLEAAANPDCAWLYQADQDEFKKIPGWPIAYFTSERVREIFAEGIPLEKIAKPCVGLQTGENAKFVRSWWEVSVDRIGFGMASREEASKSGKRWFPYNKGGEYRKWYGNQEEVVDWENDGKRVRECVDEKGKQKSRPQNTETYFRESASWSKVTSGSFVLRHFASGFIYDVAGCSISSSEPSALEFVTCTLNSCVVKSILADLSPTLNFEVGQIAGTPIISGWTAHAAASKVRHDALVGVFREDWNGYETSWEFKCQVHNLYESLGIRDWWNQKEQHSASMVSEATRLEQENNELMAKAYGLLDEVETAVDPKSLSLWANPLHAFRPKRKKQTEEESAAETEDSIEAQAELDADILEAKFREKGLKELVSYSIGCMFGRYSLDEPGLIYAHAGGEGFDPSRYKTFPADEDGILPLTDQAYFAEEDTANRFSHWVQTVWPNSPLEENLAFIAENLGQKPGESSLETIRRYLAEGFYADHLQTYKKRPIYWLFSSGKKKAFQALVYLHRYHPGTLGRMRSHYVQPLIGKLQAQYDAAQSASEDLNASTSEKKRRTLNAKKLKEQLDELLEFDKRLHHYAHKGISLDLDDGVKVNYGKFSDPAIGDILAKVKEITGGKDD